MFRSLPLDVQRLVLLYLSPEQQKVFAKDYGILASPNDITWTLRMKEDFAPTMEENYYLLKNYIRSVGAKQFYINAGNYEKAFKHTSIDYDTHYSSYLIDNLHLIKDNINIEDSTGRTLLMFAVRFSKTDMVKKLVDSGANVDKQDISGRTALMYTCYPQLDYNCVDLILKKSPNINLQDKDGKNFFMLALEHVSQGYTLEPLLKYLIAAGLDVNMRDNDGNTILSYLGRRMSTNRLNLVQLAVDAGADVNTRNNVGSTPLIILSNRGFNASYISAATMLINNKADINLADNEGNTALHHASMYYCNFKDVIFFLVDNGADINYRNSSGNTPLMLLLGNQHVRTGPVAMKLLKSGANINLKNKKGETAMDIATNNTHNSPSMEVKNKLAMLSKKKTGKDAPKSGAKTSSKSAGDVKSEVKTITVETVSEKK